MAPPCKPSRQFILRAVSSGNDGVSWSLAGQSHDENPRSDRRSQPAHRLPAEGGKVADCTAADTLLHHVPETGILHGDKGYDANAVRAKIESMGVAPDIPPKVNQLWKSCFSPDLHRDRNAIERMFCRLKDFRRIATRYDRHATNFMAAVCIAATISYWL